MVSFALPARAEFTCAAEPAKATEQARKALEANDPAKDRESLACLVEAVAALDAKLNNLIAGKTEFTGALTAPAYFYSGTQPSERRE